MSRVLPISADLNATEKKARRNKQFCESSKVASPRSRAEKSRRRGGGAAVAPVLSRYVAVGGPFGDSLSNSLSDSFRLVLRVG
jgi:hypothetical protein